MSGFTETPYDQFFLNCLKALNYAILHEHDISPDGASPERSAYDEVILIGRFKSAFHTINPHLSNRNCDYVLRKLLMSEFPHALQENRRIHHMIINGVDVDVMHEDGTIGGDTAKLIDFEDVSKNDWVAVNRFTVIEGGHQRRPDVVVFVNGLPIAVIELEPPIDEIASIDDAYNRLQTYKKNIPSLFRTNGFLVTSNGLLARIGSLSAHNEHYMPWRAVDGKAIMPKGVRELETLINGVFKKSHLLSLLRSFVVFENKGSGLIKKIAGYHQFRAVHMAVDCTIKATSDFGDRRIGVIWHMQGPSKRQVMVFYAGEIIKHRKMVHPTLIVLMDRNDLEDQLFTTFTECKDLIGQIPVKATDNKHLQKLLAVDSSGVIFTTIQTFLSEQGKSYQPILTDRRNVVVIADDPNRNQYELRTKDTPNKGGIFNGFKCLREAIPNASFIGFIGNPIEATDFDTNAIFGDYIDIYDIQHSVEDGVTVPIYYENRLACIVQDEDEIAVINEDIEVLEKDDGITARKKKKEKWARVEALVGTEDRIKMVAVDLVQHFESRDDVMDGTAMIVCMSQRICVAMYDAIISVRPDWHNLDDTMGKIKVIMTGSTSNSQKWQQHIGNKDRGDLLTKRLKNADDELKIVLVLDMWLTRFDMASMHTIYVDKLMNGHEIMQVIARVNRVFKDKPGGLVVDYIGIEKNLNNALAPHSRNVGNYTGINQAEAVAEMLRKCETVRNMFFGFNYLAGINSNSKKRHKVMAGAIEWILKAQQKVPESKANPEFKRQALKNYLAAVSNLNKAFLWAAPSDEAKELRDEIGFFQDIHSVFVNSDSLTQNKLDNKCSLQQLKSNNTASLELINILRADGLQSKNITILSDEFLFEIQRMDKQHLALEVLKKLIKDNVKSKKFAHLLKRDAFSKRLFAAINSHYINALTTAKAIEELVALARDIRAEREHQSNGNLSEEGVALYGALLENGSPVDVMGVEKLESIAHNLLHSVRSNATIDWHHSAMGRAKMRVAVKHTLKRYGFPLDLQSEAIKTILQQAEVISEDKLHKRINISD